MEDQEFLKELRKDFFIECQDFLEILERQILILEKDWEDKGAIDEIFRCFHTIKGGSATLELDRVSVLMHELESLLDGFRSGGLKIELEHIDLLLSSLDVIRKMLEMEELGLEIEEGYEGEVMTGVKLILEGKGVGTGEGIEGGGIEGGGKIEGGGIEGGGIEEGGIEEGGIKEGLKDKEDGVGFLELNEYEEMILRRMEEKGEEVYQVWVDLDDSDEMKQVNGIQVYRSLKEVSEVIKSIPSEEELLGGNFEEGMRFLILSDRGEEEVRRKLGMRGIVDRVKVELMEGMKLRGGGGDVGEDLEREDLEREDLEREDLEREDLEREDLEERDLEGRFEIEEEDEKDILSLMGRGFEVYQVEVELNELNPMRSVNGILCNNLLRDCGEVLKSEPDIEGLRNDIFYPRLRFIVGVRLSDQELRNKLYLSDVTKSLKLSKFLRKDKREGGIGLDMKGKKLMGGTVKVEGVRLDRIFNLVGELVIVKSGMLQWNEEWVEMISDYTGKIQNQQLKFVDRYLMEMKKVLRRKKDERGLKVVEFRESDVQNLSVGLEMMKEFFTDFMEYPKKMGEGLEELNRRLARISDELQDSVTKIRMVSVDQLFNRFPRLVRNLSKELGKRVDLELEGEGTELDKGIVDGLAEPLMHLVRNAIDHGIEEDRGGKSESAKIVISVKNEGNNIKVLVKDDGGGINLEKVKQRALEHGLLMDEKVTDEKLKRLIFDAGFSTVKEVTQVSGRGVGLDVVQEGIKKLGGEIDVESIEGEGTTFTLKIPMNLAIMRALLVEVNGNIYSISMNMVLETLIVECSEGKDWIEVRGEELRVVSLVDLFFHKSVRGGSKYMIVVKLDKEKVALEVENLVGEEEIVVKPLNNYYTNVLGVSGGTILGDGSVSLVLDVEGLIKMSEKKNESMGGIGLGGGQKKYEKGGKSIGETDCDV